MKLGLRGIKRNGKSGRENMVKLREPEVPPPPKMEKCTACDGTGVVKDGCIFDRRWVLCPKCKGEGKVVKHEEA